MGYLFDGHPDRNGGLLRNIEKPYGDDQPTGTQGAFDEAGEEQRTGTRGIAAEAWRVYPRVYNHTQEAELGHA